MQTSIRIKTIMTLTHELHFLILDRLLYKLSQLDLYPVIGAEIEFYLTSLDDNNFNESWEAPQLDIDIPLEKEKGTNQFETKVEYDADIKLQIQKLIDIKKTIEKAALKQNIKANFKAKPFANQPGSALHIHLHLENKNHENLFMKINQQESSLLLNSIAGLCNTMQENMLCFAPYEDSYLRYDVDHITTPSKICWGGNNRSAAIRIPINQNYNRRLEHRVACADSSPIEVVNAILFGILTGIIKKQTPSEKLHGNAFLEQYNYPKLTRNFEQAKENFQTGSFALFIANEFGQF